MSASYTCSLPRLFYSSLCVKALKAASRYIGRHFSTNHLQTVIQRESGCAALLLNLYVFFFILEGMSKLAIFSTNGEQMMDG